MSPFICVFSLTKDIRVPQGENEDFEELEGNYLEEEEEEESLSFDIDLKQGEDRERENEQEDEVIQTKEEELPEPTASTSEEEHSPTEESQRLEGAIESHTQSDLENDIPDYSADTSFPTDFPEMSLNQTSTSFYEQNTSFFDLQSWAQHAPMPSTEGSNNDTGLTLEDLEDLKEEDSLELRRAYNKVGVSAGSFSDDQPALEPLKPPERTAVQQSSMLSDHDFEDVLSTEPNKSASTKAMSFQEKAVPEPPRPEVANDFTSSELTISSVAKYIYYSDYVLAVPLTHTIYIYI